MPIFGDDGLITAASTRALKKARPAKAANDTEIADLTARRDELLDRIAADEALLVSSEFDPVPIPPGMQIVDCIEDGHGDITVLCADASIWHGARKPWNVHTPGQQLGWDFRKLCDGPPGIKAATRLLVSPLNARRVVCDGKLFERRHDDKSDPSRLFRVWAWHEIIIPGMERN